MDDEFRMAGQAIRPGTKQVVRFRITQDLDGGEVTIWIHAIRGARPGPTLGLFGLQHGNEWIELEIFRHIVQELNPEEMTGNVLVVPVCNPIAFGNLQRNTQPEADEPDLNRVWPGTHTWLTSLMARVIDREVLRYCDAVLDFHLSPWGSVMGIVLCGMDYPDPDMVRRCYEMALACGYPYVRKGKVAGVHPGPRSLAAYASTELGIPSANVDIGGAGFGIELERSWLDQDIRAVKNVMRHLGILDERIEKPDRVLVYSQVLRANPSIGGLLIPERDPDELGREVRKGELLGRIISPFTFEELEQLKAPCDGWLAYFARSYPIRPGDWAFGIASAEGAEWITP